ncbi:MAG: CopG family transcriptional regulator [Deltaproteobacteria bacterium]|nr:CopG family transcriptional regulator [Deltaproteobacteria bacterium]
MRTTLDIEDSVLRAAKKRAAEDGISLTRFLEDALRRHLEPPDPLRAPYRFRPLTRRGRLLPGVDLANRDSLHERMEGRA